MTEHDLFLLASSVRRPEDIRRVREALRADNYGTEWCLTDLIRMPDGAGQVLIDAIGGVVAGKINRERRIELSVPLRTISGEPLIVTRVMAQGDPPERMRGHHLPEQWGPVRRTLPASFAVPLVEDVWWQSALWLLYTYGWQARMGGRVRRRYSNRQARSGDQWMLVEEAFERMHPKEAPPRPLTSTTPAPVAGQPTVAAAPAETAEQARKRKARERSRAYWQKQKAAKAAQGSGPPAE